MDFSCLKPANELYERTEPYMPEEIMERIELSNKIGSGSTGILDLNLLDVELEEELERLGYFIIKSYSRNKFYIWWDDVPNPKEVITIW
jgi:hypothetical protein